MIKTKGGYLDAARHPDFDLFWLGCAERGVPEHQNLCCKLARAAARKIGGDWRDYLGTVVLLMNKALYDYDPSRGPFAKFLGNLAVRHVGHYFARHDSEQRQFLFVRQRGGRRVRLRGESCLAEVAAKQSREDPSGWDELTGPLNDREKVAVTMLYRDGYDQNQIARRLRRSPSRVSGILHGAYGKIREAM